MVKDSSEEEIEDLDKQSKSTSNEANINNNNNRDNITEKLNDQAIDEAEDSSSENDDVASIGETEIENIDELLSQINDVVGTDDLDPSECIDKIESIVAQRDELEQKISTKEDQVKKIESKLEQEREEFKQYKENRKDRLEEDRKQQVQELFTKLTDVHSQLYHALNQDHENIESLYEGVQIVFDDLEDVFTSEDVVCIDPEPGDEIDPHLHRIVTTRKSMYDSDTIVEVYTPGYEHDGTVIDPAQVVVSE